MSIRNLLGLVLSIFVAGTMIWACSFKVEQIIMGELATAAGGKYKFLTILNLVNRFSHFNEIFVCIISFQHLQAFYYILCVLNYFFGSNILSSTNRSFLQKFRDYLFASAAFPMGMVGKYFHTKSSLKSIWLVCLHEFLEFISYRSKINLSRRIRSTRLTYSQSCNGKHSFFSPDNRMISICLC